MFDVTCSECGKRQLLPVGHIRGMVPTPAGMVVAYRCWCGADGAWRAGGAVERDRVVAAG